MNSWFLSSLIVFFNYFIGEFYQNKKYCFMTESYFNVYKVYKCLHMYLKDKFHNLGIFSKSNKIKNFSIRDQEVRVCLKK